MLQENCKRAVLLGARDDRNTGQSGIECLILRLAESAHHAGIRTEFHKCIGGGREAWPGLSSTIWCLALCEAHPAGMDQLLRRAVLIAERQIELMREHRGGA